MDNDSIRLLFVLFIRSESPRKMSSTTSTKPGDRVKTVVDPEGTEGHFVHWEKTGIACDRVRLLAKNCVKFSECVQVQKRGAKECVEARDGTVPKKCYDFITTLGECKHSMLDRRSRFRGRKGELYDEDEEA
uniref:Cytochrome c oxidase assembly factor 5 n=1 Tax=Acrobeloides nanus TaxID=290746 RepID=A0A914BXF4_9BILA